MATCIRRSGGAAALSMAMLGAACLLLAAGAQPAWAQQGDLTTLLGGEAATLELDVPEAPATDSVSNATTTGNSATHPEAGRKLLGVAQYLVKGGGPNGGYVACQRGNAQVLLCYGTPDKTYAARFVVCQYNGMYQFQYSGTTYCLTLFSKPQNQVHLYQCAQPSKAGWYQRWNLYKTASKGYYTIRTGPKLSDYAFWYPGHGKALEARAGCNPETSIQCNMGVAQV